MITTPLLEEKYRTQQKLAEEARYDVHQYAANSEKIVGDVEKKYGLKFKYSNLQGGQIQPAPSEETSRKDELTVLDEHRFILPSGKTVWYEYDRKSDKLEIIFQSSEGTSYTVELTENIILHLERDKRKAESLSFISLSQLMQPSFYGNKYFQLLTNKWSAKLQEQIWAILQKPPLTDFLTLSSYTPAKAHQIIPMMAIKPFDLATFAT